MLEGKLKAKLAKKWALDRDQCEALAEQVVQVTRDTQASATA